MISFFNKLGNSWIAKGIFLLLALSMMVFWGLGGISNTTGADRSALKVGGRKVSMQELSHNFDQERNKMSKISGGYITPKRAIQAGLLDQVVQQLAVRELNAQVQEELGLAASDGAVRRYIEKNPVFKDSLGKFDANLFYAYLSGMNMNQAEFAHQMRTELATQHLVKTLELLVPRDKKLMASAAKVKKEKREIIGVLLTPEQMKVSAPTAEELKDYYEAYMEEFVVPEYRDVRLVFLKSDQFKNDYDKMYAFSRQLEDLLGAGKSLKEACDELKLNAGEVVVTDASGKDKQGQEVGAIKLLLQEVFALSEGEATSLTDVEGGFMVAGVEKITPRGYKDFKTVQGDVAKLWRSEQQKSALSQTAKTLLESVKTGKGWQGYAPKTNIISQTEHTPFPETVSAQLLHQKTGTENVLSLSSEKGIWVAYVSKVIPSKDEPVQSELDEAIRDWNQDLQAAAQGVYVQKYPIEIHTNAIQKTFSVYDNQED